MIGVVVPGFPTTVFVLVASYCFTKTSPRLARWLEQHRWFGPTLAQFTRDGGLPRAAKVRAIVAMWTAILVSSALLVQASRTAALATLAAGVVGTLSILFAVRTAPKADDDSRAR